MFNEINLYHSKIKVFINMIVLVFFALLMNFISKSGLLDNDLLLYILTRVLAGIIIFIVLISLFNFMKEDPYITFTDNSIKINPGRRTEIEVYFDDIKYIELSKVHLQRNIKLFVYGRDSYIERYPYYKKSRYFSSDLPDILNIEINPGVLNSESYNILIGRLNSIISENRNADNLIPFIVTKENQREYLEEDSVQGYKANTEIDKSINKEYFKKSYKRSFYNLLISFVFIYLIATRNNIYLIYSIASFVFFPIAKAPLDYFLGFRFKKWYDNNWDLDHEQSASMLMLSLVFFHVSVFLAPIGILFLLFYSILNLGEKINDA